MHKKSKIWSNAVKFKWIIRTSRWNVKLPTHQAQPITQSNNLTYYQLYKCIVILRGVSDSPLTCNSPRVPVSSYWSYWPATSCKSRWVPYAQRKGGRKSSARQKDRELAWVPVSSISAASQWFESILFFPIVSKKLRGEGVLANSILRH